MAEPGGCALEKEDPKLSTVPTSECKENVSEDPELDKLLDESLADFDENTESPLEPSKDETKSVTKLAKESSEQAPGAADGASGIDLSLLKNLETVTQSMGEPGGDAMDEQAFQDMAKTFNETLGSLSKNTEDLKSELNEEDLMKAIQESMNFGDEGDEGNLFGSLQGMMNSFLSKDVLYPAIKDLSLKYPSWLSSNKDKIAKKEFDQYAKQFDIIVQLCDEYDSETEQDSEEVKMLRMDRIMDLLTQMQECGSPPADIVGEMPPGLDLDANGLPKMPGANQCPMM